MTFDLLPIIDRTPAFSNVIIAVGNNMLGLSISKLVAEPVNDRPTHVNPSPH